MITDDGIPVVDSHLQRRACEYARELGLVVQTHSEDPSLRADGVMHEGRVSQRSACPATRTRPRRSWSSATARSRG
jgi:dihydroorotase-like cyclic amidohydrolase